ALQRREWLEHVRKVTRTNPAAAVFDRQAHLLQVADRACARPQRNPLVRVRARIARVERIARAHQEIEQHLLNALRATPRRRQVIGDFRPQPDLLLEQRPAQERQRPVAQGGQPPLQGQLFIFAPQTTQIAYDRREPLYFLHDLLAVIAQLIVRTARAN